ncbi:IS1595 family transposase [Parvicella tangerina]|uniref:IS1595 family transposase ISLesa1 n=1 Tax=Parvicella tangerina TaxID=2829795 RepID=A0A916JL46_9FLAO|nr:IS1595 family transposase [Parvicella tangerina]CAG5079906.1 IS1595 family transposase ISLesa1 [Parvicella tangerina]
MTIEERLQYVEEIRRKVLGEDLMFHRSGHIDGRPNCPHCKSEDIYKNGKYKDKQKYVCKSCGKGFGLLTGTCVHRIHKKELWGSFIDMTLQSFSIRDISKKLGLSIQTVFDWRHKLLSSIENIDSKEFKGIVEMDDVQMRFNQKGRKTGFIEEKRRTIIGINRHGNRQSFRLKKKRKRGISNDQVSFLLCIDRYGTIETGLLKIGKISIKSLGYCLNDKFVSRFNTDNIFVTDECKSYNLLQMYGFDHESLNIRRKEWSRGTFHLNTLNNTDGRFKSWIKSSFSSVSTKYLNNYLNYFKVLKFILDSDNKVEDFIKKSLKDDSTQVRFSKIENSYWNFVNSFSI